MKTIKGIGPTLPTGERQWQVETQERTDSTPVITYLQRHEITDEMKRSLAEEALSAAVLLIQDRLGIITGDADSIFFSGDEVLDQLVAYIGFEFNNGDICEEMEIRPGDLVRSFDFERHGDCYADGTVEEITAPIEGCQRYKIKVERTFWQGKEVSQAPTELASDPRHIYPPVNGTPKSTGGWCNNVIKLKD